MVIQYLYYLNTQLALLQPWQLALISSFTTLFLVYLIKKFDLGKFIESLQNTPFIGEKMKEMMEKSIVDKVLESFPKVNDKIETELPKIGYNPNDIVERMSIIKHQESKAFESKFVSGQVYSNDAILEKLLTDSYGLYCLSNPLHPETFPSIRKFESEVIRMTCSMMKGDSETCGTITTGGTESIIMAIFTYREWARETKGITKPEIILPVTAHAAFNKGCHYFGVNIISVLTDPITNQVNPKTVKKLITKNTILIVGSAPCYSTGTVDPIPELSEIALAHGIGLHVDSCLGGFFAPFAKKLGVDIPTFDFSVPGVTSISADTHKYGFSSKGTSVLMFRTTSLRKHMYFLFPEWTGGFYASPGMAGSRAGGTIASCWAALMYHGEAGYLENTKKMLNTAKIIREGISNHPHLELIADSKLMVISFNSKNPNLNIYSLIDALSKRGWKVNGIQNPTGAHFCITMRVVGLENQFLEKLNESVEDVLANPGKYKETGRLYGANVWIPKRQIQGFMSILLDSWTDVNRASTIQS